MFDLLFRGVYKYVAYTKHEIKKFKLKSYVGKLSFRWLLQTLIRSLVTR